MKSFFALSTLLFARAVCAQDSLSLASPPSASATNGIVSATPADNASLVASPSSTVGPSITGSSYSASPTGSSKATPSGAAAAATGAGYSIPAGVSPSCSGFLDALDSDSQFGSCTAPLLNATSAFGPSQNNKNNTQSQSTLISALNNLCSAAGCSDKYIRTQLTNFASACKAELDPSSGNAAVRDTYDILYLMQPLQDAICSKGDDGTYCVLQTPSQNSNSTTASASPDKTGAVVNAVISSGSDADIVNAAIDKFYANGASAPAKKKRDAQTVVQGAPDTETYRETGVMYLFTTGDLSAASLCTNCTGKVLAAYAQWEATVPYAAGLSNSPMLGGQGDLWSQVKQKCGSTFIASIQSTIGTNNDATTNSGFSTAQASVSTAVAGVFAVVIGFWVAL